MRKGTGKIAQPTIGGLPTKNRPFIFQPTDSGGRAGGSRGTPPMAGDPAAPQSSDPAPEIEVGQPDDSFVVYRGKRDDVLDSTPVWRCRSKDALRSPSVPAVEAFRKLSSKPKSSEPPIPN